MKFQERYEDFLMHYGVKGMKWGKRRKLAAKAENAISGKRKNSIANYEDTEIFKFRDGDYKHNEQRMDLLSDVAKLYKIIYAPHMRFKSPLQQSVIEDSWANEEVKDLSAKEIEKANKDQARAKQMDSVDAAKRNMLKTTAANAAKKAAVDAAEQGVSEVKKRKLAIKLANALKRQM